MPKGAVIKTVKLRYDSIKSAFSGRLLGLECFDKEKNSLFKAGYYTAGSDYSHADIEFTYHIIELEEGERIVGF